MTSSGPGSQLLREVSRSFYLSLRLLPPAMRAPCSLGYLLARLSDTLADTACVPADTRLALLDDFQAVLQGRLDARDLEERAAASLLPGLVHPGEKRLLLATRTCFEELQRLPAPLRAAVREVLEPITTGQASDLRAFPPSEDGRLHFWETAADLDLYTDRVAGCVGRFWTAVGIETVPRFSRLPQGELDELATAYGRALQLVNILRDLPEDLSAGRCYLPRAELETAGWDGTRSWRENLASLRTVARHWEERAGRGLLAGLRYAASLRSRRVRLASGLPARLGRQTLDLLRNRPEERFEAKLKVSRRDVRRAAAGACWAALTAPPPRLP